MQDCRRCAHFVGDIMHAGDNRCAVLHRLGGAGADVAYPTVEWMRAAPGFCGPSAGAFANRAPSQQAMPSERQTLIT